MKHSSTLFDKSTRRPFAAIAIGSTLLLIAAAILPACSRATPARATAVTTAATTTATDPDPQPESLITAGIVLQAPEDRPNMLVTTDWLAAHLSDSNVKVIQVGLDRKEYDSGHIPGAQFVAMDEVTVTGLPSVRPSLKNLVALARRLGLRHGDHIILYDDRAGLEATRAYAAFEALGLGDSTALLNGLLRKWQAEDRPMSTTAPTVKPSRFIPRTQEMIITSLAPRRDRAAA